MRKGKQVITCGGISLTTHSNGRAMSRSIVFEDSSAPVKLCLMLHGWIKYLYAGGAIFDGCVYP